MDNCKILKNCICCLSNVNELLSLGNQPLANNFHKFNDIYCDKYPLNLMYCNNCYHVQLSHIVNPEILFKNYLYLSGTTNTGYQFFKENANFIVNYKNIKNGNVLDIACNDCSQLFFFKNLGWNTYGVDPALNLQEINKDKGHNIFYDFWNIEISKLLPKMDVILAQNVFAHTEYVDEFLQACKNIMNEETSLFIQTSQKNMIINNEFDTAYHEHISFFNTNSMNILLLRNGLVLNRVSENKIHGCSYIFEIKLIKDINIYNVTEHIHNEKQLGLYDKNIYTNFKLASEKSIFNLKSIIDEYKNNNYKCIGFGAAAKGQTLISFGNILLEYIIDENPLKINLFSPNFNIPIFDLNYFIEDNSENFLIIILAWNFSDEIIKKIKKINKKSNIKIINNFFPSTNIISI